MKEKVILTQEKIKEIAGYLDVGNDCWYHILTGKVLWGPSRNREFDLDEELWGDVFNEIDAKRHEYIPFECLETNEVFQIMESFAENEVPDKKLRARLITALSNRKPFRHFKSVIDNSSYRQAWFAFKDQWYTNHVKDELDWYNNDDNHDADDDDEADKKNNKYYSSIALPDKIAFIVRCTNNYCGRSTPSPTAFVKTTGCRRKLWRSRVRRKKSFIVAQLPGS